MLLYVNKYNKKLPMLGAFDGNFAKMTELGHYSAN